MGLRSPNDTRGSPASARLLHPRVMVRLGKLPRCFVLQWYRPLRISSSLLLSPLLSVTFVSGHLRLHHLLEVRGLCSPMLLRFISLPRRSEQRLLLPPLLCPLLSLGPVAFHLHFYDSVFSSSVINRFGLHRSLDLHTSGVPMLTFAFSLL
jgi:hypothetical protein